VTAPSPAASPLSQARRLPPGVRDALLILLADERDGRTCTWSAAESRVQPDEFRRRYVSGRTGAAAERRGLATTRDVPAMRRRQVALTDRGRELALALYDAALPRLGLVTE
jgi:hypothetical protein